MPGMPLLLPPGLKLLAGWLLVCTAGALLVSLAWWAALRAQGTGLDASEMVIAPDCSTHPSGSLLFDVSSRLPLWQAVAGALAAGIVMGTVLAGVTALTRSLDTN